MMEARDTLDVESGFWKGLDIKSLGLLFALEKPPRNAEVELLVDSDQLFGSQFV